MRSRFVTAILLAGLTCGTVFPQSINTQRLDSLFNILAEKNQAMGAVALSKNGTVLYSRAIGYSAISGAEKKHSTGHTKYRIGSITKMFTAVMVFQLVEEGKLTLDATIDAYFPDLPNAAKITVGHLLGHRSGIFNFTSDPDYPAWMTQPKTHKEMAAIIAKHKPDFDPDAKASYSNSNYVLLGYIVEAVTKRPYAENVKDRITAKIGLSDTYCGGKANIAGDECFSYRFDGGWKQMPETDLSIPGGAGSLVSTPTDLAKFLEALFSLKLVSQNSLDRMKTIRDGLGMGMIQIPFYERRAFGHNGGIDGFASTAAYFPEDSLAIAYCTNGQAYPMNDILIGVLSICFNRDYSIPRFIPVSLSADDLTKYAGVYSSTQLPLKITITKGGTGLIAQATGQSSFPLDASEKDTFTFNPAGIRMEFNPSRQEMTLKQGGGVFLFTKEK